jgi:hypothetical protein
MFPDQGLFDARSGQRDGPPVQFAFAEAIQSFTEQRMLWLGQMKQSHRGSEFEIIRAAKNFRKGARGL